MTSLNFVSFSIDLADHAPHSRLQDGHPLTAKYNRCVCKYHAWSSLFTSMNTINSYSWSCSHACKWCNWWKCINIHVNVRYIHIIIHIYTHQLWLHLKKSQPWTLSNPIPGNPPTRFSKSRLTFLNPKKPTMCKLVIKASTKLFSNWFHQLY